MGNNSLYDTLGVPPTAAQEEIKKAYRKLAKEHHPDTNGSTPEAEERFKLITQAYTILKDKGLRAEYDLTGKIPNIKEEPSEEDMVVINATIFFDKVFDHVVQKLLPNELLFRVRLFKVMRREIGKEIKTLRTTLKGLNKALSIIEQMPSCVKKKKGMEETNFVENVIQKRIDMLTRERKEYVSRMDAAKHCLQALNPYKWKRKYDGDPARLEKRVFRNLDGGGGDMTDMFRMIKGRM